MSRDQAPPAPAGPWPPPIVRTGRSRPGHLGLLAVEITVYAAEVNVVLARRLWPRAMVQPPLTEADRASMALQALQNQRRDEQHIEVTFSDRPPGAQPGARTPRRPEDILDQPRQE